MSFKRGDVLIALVPHADVSGLKPRPVVVVQADAYNAKIANIVVAAVTSNLTFAAGPASLLIDVSTAFYDADHGPRDLRDSEQSRRQHRIG
jgi:mRNA-degrading endonuclease toxin of MazEF toxin-antitoxin module